MLTQPTRQSDVWPVTHQRDHGYALVPCQAPGCRRLVLQHPSGRRAFCDTDCRDVWAEALSALLRPEQAQPMESRTA